MKLESISVIAATVTTAILISIILLPALNPAWGTTYISPLRRPTAQQIFTIFLAGYGIYNHTYEAEDKIAYISSDGTYLYFETLPFYRVYIKPEVNLSLFKPGDKVCGKVIVIKEPSGETKAYLTELVHTI